MRQRAQHRRDHREEGHRHGEIERELGRDRRTQKRARERRDIPGRAVRRAGPGVIGELLGQALLRRALVILRGDGKALVDHEIGDERLLPARRGAQMRRERGRIHRHAQIDRERGQDHQQRRRVVVHQLHRGELRGARNDQDREPHHLDEVQPGLGRGDAEEGAKGHDHQHEGQSVAQAAPVGGGK
ncbi:hypothetical protein SDC9_12937 [bioreactor metagenome]|uniref:Uncharacterized protein n=1 Tax=bioreactor metagenome TaxID=1076179 RepID=A0A644TJX2_9ZZZZ